METFIKGSSSLLFIISTVKAIYCSKIILWKLSNGILVVASYLCNAYDYKSPLLLLDYSAICLVSMSYMNSSYINIPLLVLIVYEYKSNNTIENSKNVLFTSAVLKSIINTYYYVDKIYFYTIVSSAVSSILVYAIRYNLHKNNNMQYNLMITYIFHSCITIILYVSSITAI